MSVKIMSDVFEKSKTEGNTRLVLLCLADCSNDEGVSWPSIRKLSQKANLSEPMLKKHLNALISIGLVSREEREDQSGRQTANLYTIDLAKIGDDEITRDVWQGVIPVSRQKKFGEVIQVTTGGDNSGHSVGGVTKVSLSYMNHHKEPSKEPSCGFVANAPKTTDDLFPNHPPTNQGIAARSSMDSRPNAMTVNMAAFKTKANRLLGRRDSTPWSAKEIAASKPHLNTPEEDWQLLAKYYANRGNEGFYTRTSMLTLLNNWAGEIDKARAKFPAQEEIDWANVKPNQ